MVVQNLGQSLTVAGCRKLSNVARDLPRCWTSRPRSTCLLGGGWAVVACRVDLRGRGESLEEELKGRVVRIGFLQETESG